MGTKVTSSSGSVLEEPEIQKLQMQAKIFKENSLNKLNALKSTTQLLERQSILYQQAFAQLFGDKWSRTSIFSFSHTWKYLETLLNAETLHEMDSKSAHSVIKIESNRNLRDYTKMTAQTFKETSLQNRNSIENYSNSARFKRFNHRIQVSDETSSGIVTSYEEMTRRNGAHYVSWKDSGRRYLQNQV
ncbi:hypothetical protein Tco_0060356 [Tanacetum coccineum]